MNIGILGAGYSGVMLSLFLKLKDENIEITLFDHNDKVNKKLLATGNGRCNLGNLEINKDSYNCEMAYKLLNDFDIKKQIELFNELGLMTRVINNTLVYPNSLSSNQVVAYLNKILNYYKIKVIDKVNLLDYKIENNEVITTFSNHKSYKFDKFIFATGGKSKSTLGSDGSIFELLKKHKYKINALKPGLTPIKAKENVRGIENERLKCHAKLYLDKVLAYEEDGEVLFKKDGLSGILIMNIESIIKRNKEAKKTRIVLDLFNDKTEEELFQIFKKYPRFRGFSFLEGIFTIKMSDFIRKNSNVKNLYNFTSSEINLIVKYVKNMEFTYLDSYDFNDSQVTIGGINFNDLNEDLSSKLEPNIYMIGEMLDIDGLCGGYNLMASLASSYRVYKSLLDLNS